MGEGPVSLGRRNEVVLIAGCPDGGIGIALALEFCNDGFTVLATSRSVSTMKVFKWHQHIEVLALDLLSEESFKEAVESFLALELKPFNIDVMLLVPGGVVTGLAPKGADLLRNNLSALQIFKPYQQYLLKRSMISHLPNCTPAPLFARKSVGATIAKSTPASFTYDFLSQIYRFLCYCPYWIRDWGFSSMPKVITTKKQS